ncbi:MAG: FAD-dependent oxidoreductase [Gemmatimonadales bacterium]|nr:MAG: FAD-dependent oxidoreductase [Gemmatimonadales bacterium]
MAIPDVLVVGAGIYGLTTALELVRRGSRTEVVDPGPIPHPLAASTDISKVIRMEYGSDAEYMAMAEAAITGWQQWNEALGETVFHRTGVAMLTRQSMAPGGFEFESFHLLRLRNHAPERLSADEISRRFPAWKPGAFVDGFFHAEGGFAESGRVIELLFEMARREGVTFHLGEAAASLLGDGKGAAGRVRGVRTDRGTLHRAGQTVVSAGSWTPGLVPELGPAMKASGHPVFHLEPADPTRFGAHQFPTFTADVSRSGWYGFPLHPRAGVVKIANHGAGRILDPVRDARVVTEDDARGLRAFLAETFPDLEGARIAYTRRCLYCDTVDEHFWIDRHPEREGLIVAAGGSGHGFKFAPILGTLVADAVEGRPNPRLSRFRWREFDEGIVGQEAARFHG